MVHSQWFPESCMVIGGWCPYTCMVLCCMQANHHGENPGARVVQHQPAPRGCHNEPALLDAGLTARRAQP